MAVRRFVVVVCVAFAVDQAAHHGAWLKFSVGLLVLVVLGGWLLHQLRLEELMASPRRHPSGYGRNHAETEPQPLARPAGGARHRSVHTPD